MNKAEIPDAMKITRGREMYSSMFGFHGLLTLCSYMTKRKKLVTLLSTIHHEVAVSEDESHSRKPVMVLDYNSTKGAVDSYDERVQTYSCNRKINRWPMKLFFNCVDLATLNSCILWRIMHPEDYSGKLQARRLFISDLCEELIIPLIEKRSINPYMQTPVRKAIISTGLIQEGSSSTSAAVAQQDGKPRRCSLCKTRRLVRKVCDTCRCPVCPDHASFVCLSCKNE